MSFRALSFLVVPLVGLAELGAALYQPGRAPTLEEWRAVRPAVEELRKQGELVVIAPRWAEPNARHAFGDALLPLRDVARPDESAYGRAIEVSILGAKAPELGAFRLVHERTAGKFQLRTFENPAASPVIYDFVDQVAAATVLDLASEGEKPCRWNPSAPREAGGLHGPPAFPGRRHQCPGATSHFVGATVIEDEGWRARRCLWAQPTSSHTLVIRFSDVPLGKVIHGHGSLPFWNGREKRGGSVEMEVLVRGASLGRFTHGPGDGWKLFEFPSGEHAGTRADVEFRVRFPRPQNRQFCFQADTR